MPTKTKASSQFATTSKSTGGSKLTGTSNAATGKPYTKGSVTARGVASGKQYVTPGTKTHTTVEGWETYPFKPTYVYGKAQHAPQEQLPQQKIEKPVYGDHIKTKEIIPVTDSEFIRQSKAKPGDIVTMPDGRKIKYEIGPKRYDKESLGRTHALTVEKEYDQDSVDVKKQYAIPSKTKMYYGISGAPEAKIAKGKIDTSVKRDSTSYYPIQLAKRIKR